MDHRPVLAAEALEMLAVRAGAFYLDGTLGLGGHAALILEHSAPTGRLLGLDKDGEAIDIARRRLARFGERVRLVQADFREAPTLLAGERPDGMLLDLGVSSVQLDSAERGFSFQMDGPLDMRMDRSRGITAAEVVNRSSETELSEIIHRYGEEPAARRVARAIVSARVTRRIATTRDLAEIVRRTVRRPRRGIDPATLTFQALRIHVNRELQGLEEAVRALAGCLALGGRLVTIAFHSLEDRVAKHTFRGLARDPTPNRFRVLTRKAVRPSPEEVRANPRARSARLRCLEKVAA